MDRCASILTNFGAWPASSKTGGSPWPVTKYSQKVGAIMEQLAARRQTRGTHVGWLSNMPYSLNAGEGPYFNGGHPRDSLMMSRENRASRKRNSLVNCPPTDWRFPHVLEAYNQAAARAAERYSVDFIDVWSIAFPLLELTYDGIHYGTDPVALPISLLVVRWLQNGSSAVGGADSRACRGEGWAHRPPSTSSNLR